MSDNIMEETHSCGRILQYDPREGMPLCWCEVRQFAETVLNRELFLKLIGPEEDKRFGSLTNGEIPKIADEVYGAQR